MFSGCYDMQGYRLNEWDKVVALTLDREIIIGEVVEFERGLWSISPFATHTCCYLIEAPEIIKIASGRETGNPQTYARAIKFLRQRRSGDEV